MSLSQNYEERVGKFSFFARCHFKVELYLSICIVRVFSSTLSLDFFQKKFEFCTFLPKFSNILRFFNVFFALFLKNRTPAFTF